MHYIIFDEKLQRHGKIVGGNICHFNLHHTGVSLGIVVRKKGILGEKQKQASPQRIEWKTLKSHHVLLTSHNEAKMTARRSLALHSSTLFTLASTKSSPQVQVHVQSHR